VKAGKKKAYLEDHPLTRLSELIGAFNAVLFSPEDVDLVLRDPSQRRRLLDILVSQSNTSYLADLEQYYRILSQRNRLLKERGRLLLSDPAQLSAWDSQLAGMGARIVCGRMDALREIQPLASTNYDRIASTAESLKTVYRSAVGPEDQDRAEEVLAEALRARRSEEAQIGFTLSGPHRDHLVFTLDERAAHKFASKGQLKTALLAWKLAEASFLESQTGKMPVLLMDDVFSELDRRRALAVLELIGDSGQVVLTSARDPDIGLGERGCSIIDL
jgi:DNA replication and repair protein RecF